MLSITKRPAIWTGIAAFALLGVAILLLKLFTGSSDPEQCFEADLKHSNLEDFARDLEDANGTVGRFDGLKCRGLPGIMQSKLERQKLGLKITTALIGDKAFRFGLYDSHIERVLPDRSKRPDIQAILESVDQLTQDHKALRLCPTNLKTKAADYAGLETPLISAMILKSSVPRHEGDAGKLAIDLSHILELAQALPRFPASSCPDSQRYFAAMDAFVGGIHPLAKDCRPRMDGDDLVLDCVDH